MVKITLAGAKKNVIHTRLNWLRKRAITLHAELEVGAVVAHHIDQGLWQLIALLFIHPSLHRLHYLRVDETVDMVPSLSVSSVRREESLIEQSLKGHSEVVAL